MMKKWSFIYKQGLAQNEATRGNYPMWGTCLGFEMMMFHTSNKTIKTSEPDSINQLWNLKFIPENFNQSRFKDVLRPEIVNYLENDRVSYFSHHFGFRLSAFEENKLLTESFFPVAYYTKQGKKYVSIVQHKKYPIIGVQFHPEKILFEHKERLNIKLTLPGSIASQEMSRVLFAPTLSNLNMFENQLLLNHFLLENFSTVKTFSVFESLYVFEESYFKSKNLYYVPSNKVPINF